MSTNTTNDELRGLIDTILTRLDTIESTVGIEVISTTEAVGKKTKKRYILFSNQNKYTHAQVNNMFDIIIYKEEAGPTPAVVAYRAHIENYVKPFCKSCDELIGLDDISKPIYTAFSDNIGHIIELASLCPKPIQATASISNVLKPYLKPAQDSITKVQSYRLDRDYDYHYKAISEMMCICSWVIVTTPPVVAFVRESIGSCDYWCNKIRKEYKDDSANKVHIVFCNTMRAMIYDLLKYCKEYHLSGVAFNPRGSCKTLVEAESALKKKKEEAHGDNGGDSKISDVSGDGIQNELVSKMAGDSAASGLKKVNRDQQTWREEYKKPSADTTNTPTPQPSTPSNPATTAKTITNQPKMEFVAPKQKWIVEYQTPTTTSKALTIDITNSKQQVYIYKCSNITITIQNKFNTVVLDSCTKCNLVFETAISSCEVVNCKSVQIQTLGLCPSFTIDKTDSCLIYLSEETKSVSTFVTSKSSEMNVSYPDGNGEMKEIPIPEQFSHKLDDSGSALSTRVSDLYH